MAAIKVLHFVTGGFSGSTSVAVELVKAGLANPQFDSLLVLRRKKSKHDEKIQKLRDQGVPLEVVPGWNSLATIFALVKICRSYQPDIIVCHGFSDHLWGRYAGLIAGVPHMVHVEHNSRERYTPWRLLQARWLAKYTDSIVGCSEGVRQALVKLGFSEQKTITINNGINTAPYQGNPLPLTERTPGIVMTARFAKQKDHLTLIKAVALLRDKKFFPPVYLAGAGSKKHMKKAKALARDLLLSNQIKFLGHCDKVPELLQQNTICTLATHYEGMPLALCEGMAAGCVIVASEVVGVKEMITHSKDGFLVTPGSPESLARGLEMALTHPLLTQKMASRARERALRHLSVSNMVNQYEQLFLALVTEHELLPRESLFY